MLTNIVISCIPAFYGMEPKAASELEREFKGSDYNGIKKA